MESVRLQCDIAIAEVSTKNSLVASDKRVRRKCDIVFGAEVSSRDYLVASDKPSAV